MNNKVNIGKDLYLKGRIGWRGLSKDEYLEHSLYRIINATALLDNKINWDNCGYISQERFEESKEIILQEDDILISKDGTLGKIGFVKNKPRFATVASGIFVLRNTKKDILDTTYLYHFLKSNIFKDFIKRNKANGSTINHLYQRDLVRLDLDLPSIKGQQRIGSILSNIDEKIELNNKINAELENIAKTLYDYWFVQFDFPDENNQPYKSSGGKMVYNDILKREIPIDWKVKELQLFCNIFTGKKDVKMANNKGLYHFFSCAPEPLKSDEYICDAEAILVAGNGSYTGRVTYYNGKFDLYQRTYACTLKDNADKIMPFLYFYMKFFFEPHFKGGTHGSAIPYIVLGDLTNLGIPFDSNIIYRSGIVLDPDHNLVQF